MQFSVIPSILSSIKGGFYPSAKDTLNVFNVPPSVCVCVCVCVDFYLMGTIIMCNRSVKIFD